MATAPHSERVVPGALNQVPVSLSILSFILILFYCLGMRISGQSFVQIQYVMKSDLKNRGIQKLSGALPGLIQWLPVPGDLGGSHLLALYLLMCGVAAATQATLTNTVISIEDRGGFPGIHLCTRWGNLFL